MNKAIHQESFKALADQTRLRIVVLLTKREICVCDITSILGLPQSTVSRHLTILKHAGLVADRREGKWVHYKLADNTLLTHLTDYFSDLSKVNTFQNDQVELEKSILGKSCK